MNGCTCAGKIYDESWVDSLYCCEGGFSDETCPESLGQEAERETVFGSTQEEVEARLVYMELGGWPVLVHEKAEAAYRRVNQALESIGYKIVEPIEGYAWRYIQGTPLLSTHSLGIAVDINPSTNPSCGATQSCRCLNELITDMTPEFVQAFKDAGFEWGGDWSDHPDPMHFEWTGWH